MFCAQSFLFLLALRVLVLPSFLITLAAPNRVVLERLLLRLFACLSVVFIDVTPE
jgi:hypothetical protein